MQTTVGHPCWRIVLRCEYQGYTFRFVGSSGDFLHVACLRGASVETVFSFPGGTINGFLRAGP